MRLCFKGRDYKLDLYTLKGYSANMVVKLFSPTRIGTALVIMSFLALTLLSFNVMIHGSDGQMQGDCPFSAAGVPTCPPDELSAAIHHISAYHSLLSVPGGFGTTAAIIALLLSLCAALIFSVHSRLFEPPAVRKYVYSAPPTVPRNKKITHWLSLFENSPSLV